LRRVISEISPDVVVVNVPVPGLGNVVAGVCGTLPLVVVLHAATTLKAGHPAFNLLARSYEATAGARLLRRADHIVAVSSYVRGTLPARWQAKTLVVNNAVAVRPLEPSDRGPRRFVFLGQLNRTHAWKGLDQVLAACAQCQTSDAPVELVVGGDGDDLSRYRDVAARLGLRRVSFRGWVGAEERRSLLATATATIVYPTTCNDALPTVILESWEAGTPVVASRIGALPTIVNDSSDGLLVEPANPGALAEALMRVAGDGQLAAQLGAAGRRRVLAEFDWDDQVTKMEDLLGSLTSGSPVRVAVPAL
jgi:rhamnosyl/mannosyltransferase